MTNTPAMVTEDPLHATPKFSGPAEEVAPGVFMHSLFVNTYAVKTPDGLLLIDPGTMRGAASTYQAIRGWTKEPVNTIVYTHGHIDHAFGGKPFLTEGTVRNIVAQENCVSRFQRYALTHGFNEIINQRQFGADGLRFPNEFDWPTLTFRDGLVQRMGGLELRYRAAKGETDDHCYVWVPEKSYLFSATSSSGVRPIAAIRRRSSAIPSNGRRRWRKWPRWTPNGCFRATASSCMGVRKCAAC